MSEVDVMLERKEPVLPCKIRWITGRDREAVEDLEQETGGMEWSNDHARWVPGPLAEVLPVPWTWDEYVVNLRGGNCVGMVADSSMTGDLPGVMVYESLEDRFYMVRFLVHIDYRRRGVGTQMMAEMFGKLRKARSHRNGINRITLEVRETDLSSQLFLRSQGFRARPEILRGFYRDTGEDGYFMEHVL